MMATDKPKRAPRPSFPDHLRHTDRITLRLDPKIAARLRKLSAKRAITIGEVVALAIDALEGKKS